MVANGDSLQKLPKEARVAACHNRGVELDIANALPTTLLNLLEANAPNHNKHVLKLYCENYKNWRQALADYFCIDAKEAKKQILSLFYGGRPRADLPFLWTLKQDIEETIDIILELDEFNYLRGSFEDKANPKFTKFAYAVAKKENEILNAIIDRIKNDVNAEPICLVFDAVIFKISDASMLNEIAECVKKLEDDLKIRIVSTNL